MSITIIIKLHLVHPYNCRRQYHSPRANITVEGNITRQGRISLRSKGKAFLYKNKLDNALHPPVIYELSINFYGDICRGKRPRLPEEKTMIFDIKKRDDVGIVPLRKFIYGSLLSHSLYLFRSKPGIPAR